MKSFELLTKIVLIYGILFGIALLLRAYKERSELKNEPGSFIETAFGEAIVFFLATSGFPDFVINTLFMRKRKLVSDEQLPPTLMAATVTPGCVIAYFCLSGAGNVNPKSVLLCCLAVAIGCFIGSFLVGKIPKEKIRIVMGVALLFSIAMLIVKMIISAGRAGNATALSAKQLLFVLPIICAAGIVNMCGVPIKPINTALLLLCGLDPKCVLTIMLTMACVGPIAGSFNTFRNNKYSKKITCSAVIFGSIGALAGSMLMLTIPSGILNVLLLIIMTLASITLLRK